MRNLKSIQKSLFRLKNYNDGNKLMTLHDIFYDIRYNSLIVMQHSEIDTNNNDDMQRYIQMMSFLAKENGVETNI